MTAMMRQIHKQTLTIALLLQAFFALALSCPGAWAGGLNGAIVTDPLTGVAIDGMDPVSYFTDPQPLQGSPDFEFDWGGVPWYFALAANRDAFARAPAVYAPQFGGHATMSLARGYLSDGNPRIFAVVEKRLYLFYSLTNRDAFLLDPAAAIARARAQWVVFAKQFANSDPAWVDTVAARAPGSAEAPAEPVPLVELAVPAVPATPSANGAAGDPGAHPPRAGTKP